MRKAVCVIGVLAVIALGSWANAQQGLGNPKAGQAVFQQNCLRCHGEGGDGTGLEGRYLIVPPANFQAPKSRLKTDYELFTIISYGLAVSPMHGWRDRLTEEQIWDVISYIRMLAPFSPIS